MSHFSFTLVDKKSSIIGQPYRLERGQTLLKNLLLNEITTNSKCGGKAICGHCQVQIISGRKYCNKPVAEEKAQLTGLQIKQGWRLACQLYCLKDVSLYLPSKV